MRDLGNMSSILEGLALNRINEGKEKELSNKERLLEFSKMGAADKSKYSDEISRLFHRNWKAIGSIENILAKDADDSDGPESQGYHEIPEGKTFRGIEYFKGHAFLTYKVYDYYVRFDKDFVDKIEEV